jgi:Spy/CpxP family protein refolding chaperone
MKKLPLLILTLTSLLALPMAVRAEDAKPGGKPGGKPGEGRGGHSPEERLKMMTEKLGLTSEQQDKVKAIMEKNAPQMKELMAKGRENLSEEDKTKMREMMKAQFEEIGAVLTPEQKDKWKEGRGPGGPGGERRGKPGEKKPDAAK